MSLLHRRASEIYLKDLFTFASLGFALMAVYFVIQKDPFAPWFVLLSVVADWLDGKVARITGKTNDFGVQLDSLADAVAFGAAPAVLNVVFSDSLGDYFVIAASVFYGVCIITRLAWFNLQDPKAEKGAYYGLPSPLAALGAVAVPAALGWAANICIASIAVFGFLAVSGYRSSKASLKKAFGPLGFLFS